MIEHTDSLSQVYFVNCLLKKAKKPYDEDVV
jgi:hypothetical protein